MTPTRQLTPTKRTSVLDGFLNFWQLRGYLEGLDLSAKRRLLYRGAMVALVVWGAVFIYVVINVIPNGIYWLTYYVANYDHGFVRRGLGGELIKIFPARDYFIVARALMTASVALYLIALLILARHILLRGEKSERRVVVSLLVPVLPCSISFALMGPRPEFVAASAFLLFVTALTRFTSNRAIIASSVAYGLTISVMTFVHEAIALEFMLGAVLAIAVLAPVSARATRTLCTALAVGPGLISLSSVTVFGRKDLGPQICKSIPHELMSNTFGVPRDKFFEYVTGHFQSMSDYHQWACRHIVPTLDKSISMAMHDVRGFGVYQLTAGFVHGLLVCVFTIWLISYFTAVPIREFVNSIRDGFLMPALAASGMIILFVTGVDWIRWWAIILINIACVFLLFAADRPEIESPVSTRQVKAFIAALIFMACVPLAGAAGYGSGFPEKK